MSTSFQITLAGSNEVPGVSTASFGYGNALYDSTANTLEYWITVVGVDFGPILGQPSSTPTNTDDVTGANFHNAAAGANGPTVLDWIAQDDDVTIQKIGTTYAIHGLWEVTDPSSVSINSFSATLAAAAIGTNVALYADIQTVGNPTGQIRGQLVGLATDGNETVQGSGNNDVLAGLGGNDILKGDSGDDILIGGAGNNTYDGGSDNTNLSGGPGDAADYRYDPAGVTVNLATGTGTNGYGGTDNFNVLDFFGNPAVTIESVYGSASDDHLTGDAHNNTFRGRGGNNTLDGGGDTAGRGDTLDYSEAPSGVTISLVSGGSNGYGGIDTVSNFENLIGSAFNDDLTGDANNNFFAGGAGNNAFHGGAGQDTVAYGGAIVAISIDLTQGGGANAYGGTDTFDGIEVINGTQFNDTLIGDGNDNIFNGGTGNDTILGGGGSDILIGGGGIDLVDGGDGNDFLSGQDIGTIVRGGNGDDQLSGQNATLIGGPGADKYISSSNPSAVVSYAGSSAGVTVNINAGTASGGDADGDTFLGTIPTGFSGLVGSDFDDVLSFTNPGNAARVSGGAGNDILTTSSFGGILDGGDGNDTLNGGNDRQTFRGGAGNNIFNGGDGGSNVDTADYALAPGGISVTLGGSGGNGFGGVDTLNGIENVIGSNFDDVINGDGFNNTFVGRGGNNTINGGGVGDNDTVDYSAATSGISITIGGAPGANGFGGTDTLSNIESVIGTIFDDTLIGDGSDNTLTGGRGHNALDGQGGNDTVNYLQASGALSFNAVLTVDLAAGSANNGVETGAKALVDTLSSIENVIGSLNIMNLIHGNAANNRLVGGDENDILFGGDGSDTLLGGSSVDLLEGGAGADALDGGTELPFFSPAADTASYQSSGAGVTVNLATGTGSGGDAQGDTLTAIENLVGSASADVLTGDAGDNIIEGGGGGDQIDGGGGVNTASYASAPTGVTVNLATASGTGGDAAGDTLTNIRNINGSAYDDTFIAGPVGNAIDGGIGSDTMTFAAAAAGVSISGATGQTGDAAGDSFFNIERVIGSAFNDSLGGAYAYFDGGDGDDFFSPGAGTTFEFVGGAGVDTIAVTTGVANLAIGLSLSLVGSNIGTFSGVENLTGGSDADLLTGNANANVITGNQGNDVIVGGAGNDTITGGDGTDLLAGGAGDDTIRGDAAFGGSENDILVYTPGGGADTFTDFDRGGATDRIDLSWFANINSLNDVLVLSTQSGADTFVDFGGGDSITLTNVQKTSLTAGNFSFNGGPGVTFGGGAQTDTWLVLHSNIASVAGTRGDGAGGTDILQLDLSDFNGSLTSGVGNDAGGFGAGTAFYQLSSGETVWHRNFEQFHITGGTAADNFSGGELDDILIGNAGNDTLNGLGGTDLLSGGAGDDILNGGSGADYLFGGDGDDTLNYGGGPGNLLAIGDGGAGNDTINGGDISGYFHGGAGNDTVRGGSRSDSIFGDAGADILTGGLAGDEFVFDGTALADAAASAIDIITDYNQSGGAYSLSEQDGIDLTALFPNADGTTQIVNTLVRAATGSSGALLQVDLDGAANGQHWITIAQLDGLHAGDVVIVSMSSNVSVVDIVVGGGAATSDHAPVIASDGGADTASISVPENTTAVTTVIATDADAGSTTLTYTIVGGADQSRFSINTTTGVLTLSNVPNFEAPIDADANNSYIVQVSASDGLLADTQTLTVNVTDVNEGGNHAPIITSNGGNASAGISVAENQTAVTAVVATDPDAGQTVAYSLSGGADQGKFQIDGSSGALSFVAAPDFETPTDSDHNNSYIVQVRASDGSLFDDQILTVAIADVNEGGGNHAPIITSNGGEETAIISVVENSTAVTTVRATDPDAGTTLTYSIAGGADQARFQIDGSSGALSFVTAPDFEKPADADDNNTYVIQVRASDGSLSDDQTLSVSVNDANDLSPTVHWMASVDLGSHPAGWLPATVGDFNNDGTSDILWFNSATTDVDLWKISNGQWAGSIDVGTHPAGYAIAGSGDFNKDGTSDVLWYNSTTAIVDVWKISNGQWAGSVPPMLHPAGYTISSTGDFNGDGIGDVLWHNAAKGDVDLWKMFDGQWAGSINVGDHPAGYSVAGSGDFNKDGTSDLLWYNPTTRDVDLWLIANGQWAGSVDLGTHPAGYTIAGVGDFNHDGTSDIAWFNPTTSDVDIWQIVNGHWSASADLGSHPAGWTIAGVGDFNHDNTSDILWQQTGTTHVEGWLLSNH